MNMNDLFTFNTHPIPWWLPWVAIPGIVLWLLALSKLTKWLDKKINGPVDF